VKPRGRLLKRLRTESRNLNRRRYASCAARRLLSSIGGALAWMITGKAESWRIMKSSNVLTGSGVGLLSEDKSVTLVSLLSYAIRPASDPLPSRSRRTLSPPTQRSRLSHQRRERHRPLAAMVLAIDLAGLVATVRPSSRRTVRRSRSSSGGRFRFGCRCWRASVKRMFRGSITDASPAAQARAARLPWLALQGPTVLFAVRQRGGSLSPKPGQAPPGCLVAAASAVSIRRS
jgi:hypothetical protein